MFTNVLFGVKVESVHSPLTGPAALPCPACAFQALKWGFMCAEGEREKVRAAVTWEALFHSPRVMATDRGARNMPSP